MTLVTMQLALSAPARLAWASLQSHQEFDHIAEHFFDALRHERYRDFAVMPEYYTERYGNRLAVRASQQPPGEKLHRTRLTMRLKTLQQMKQLEAKRGLMLGWQVEEILYFGFQRGMIRPQSTDLRAVGVKQ